MPFDKEFLDAMLSSAGIGSAIGWALQFLAWKGERAERMEAHRFIIAILDKTVTERTQGTGAIVALTTAVNSIVEVVRKSP